MVNFHKPTAAGFTAGMFFIGVLAMSTPVLAHGSGGHSGRPEVVPGPVIVSGSTTGRAVGSWDAQRVGCSTVSRPITSASGTTGYRRVQVCY
jgi:hypothetical protein